MKKILNILILTLISLTFTSPATAQEKDSIPAHTVVIPSDVQNLIDESNRYCEQSYLTMEQNTLEKFMALLGEKDYPEAQTARDKVGGTLSLWHEIDGYNRLLYVPFQYDKVKRARERIYIMQDEMSPEQYEDIYEKLDSPLQHMLIMGQAGIYERDGKSYLNSVLISPLTHAI